MWAWNDIRNRRTGDRSVLSPGVCIKGNLESEGEMEIRGRVEGDIVHAGRLIIARGAVWTGNIRADQLVVAGQVRGNVDVTEQMELQAGGQLIGDVSCARLIVAPGAIFEGRNRMAGEEPRQAPGPAPMAGAGPGVLDRLLTAGQSLPPDTPLAILAGPVRTGEREVLLALPAAPRDDFGVAAPAKAESRSDAPAFYGGFAGGLS